ncbi:MAG: hypothetical protein LBQ84_01405 [Flavobacteriaceae bacterium]|jgi:hypothetical protein|nr:hypothetical protein [Flavobacteriaceae bacterium]
MNVLTFIKKIIPLFALLLFITQSCKDDDLTEQDGNQSPTETQENGTGWIPATEEDWAGIPVLTDVSQLNGLPGAGSYKSAASDYAVPYYEELPVFHQGGNGTCVSSAVAQGLALMIRNYTGMPFKNDALYTSNTSTDTLRNSINARFFSVNFLHYHAVKRAHPNTYPPGIDFSTPQSIAQEGTNLPDVFNVLQDMGVPVVTYSPYQQGFIIAPTPEAETAALFQTDKFDFDTSGISGIILRVLRIRDINAETLKKILKEKKLPIYFGMSYPRVNGVPSFEVGYGKEKIVTKEQLNSLYTDFKESIFFLGFGYHAMTIVDYDESKDAFKVLNSWGPKWGKNGWFWMHADVLTGYYDDSIFFDTPMVSDFGVIHFKEPHPTGKTVESLLYEFNGYKEYKKVKYSTKGVSFGTKEANPGTIVVGKEGAIEYPAETVIPKNGTIELVFKVTDFYHNLVDENTGKYPTQSAKMIDSIWTNSDNPNGWKDRQNSTVIFSSYTNGTGKNTKDGFSLMMNRAGKVWLEIGNKDFIEPKEDELENAQQQIIYDILEPSGTIDTSGKTWNKIALSYESNGDIMLVINGIYSIATNTSHKSINTSQKAFTLGHSYTNRRTFIYKIFEVDNKTGIKEFKKATLYKHKLEEGFIGNILKFRTSEKPKDWLVILEEKASNKNPTAGKLTEMKRRTISH